MESISEIRTIQGGHRFLKYIYIYLTQQLTLEKFRHIKSHSSALPSNYLVKSYT